MTLHAKMTMPGLQRYPGYLNLIKNGEDTAVFRLNKCLFLRVFPLLLIKKEITSHFRIETANESKQFKETKTWISIYN